MHRWSRIVVLALVVGLMAAAPAAARPKKPGWHPLKPAAAYRGDFPDPSVIRVGNLFIAHGTNTHGLTLPTLISANLKRWFGAPATATNPTGDGLLVTPSWTARVRKPGGRLAAEVWAPTVTRLGPGRYVLAYATKVRSRKWPRMCVSIATGRAPWGPFVDRHRRPVVCPRKGAIDPQVYRPARGRPWLLWKTDRKPARIFTRALNRQGTGFAAKSRRHLMARVAQRWEGGIVENPGLIRYRQRYYLFYSGNRYGTGRYAVSYLICRTRHGGCHRPRTKPLIASGRGLRGPGGAAPFVDRHGRLRLAYHAWGRRVGYADSPRCKQSSRGCPQRRLYIATVRVKKDGRLVVVRRR